MSKNLPRRDPIGAYQRKTAAARRVGTESQCVCGETRPEALIAGSKPIMCSACDRKWRGQATFDDHHVAGEANSPVTIPVPVNDHRAELNAAQQDWPRRTLENPERSPLLAAAASIRGFVDYIMYLIKRGLLWAAEMLEKLDAVLAEKLGPKWWLGTPLAQFAPRG